MTYKNSLLLILFGLTLATANSACQQPLGEAPHAPEKNTTPTSDQAAGQTIGAPGSPTMAADPVTPSADAGRYGSAPAGQQPAAPAVNPSPSKSNSADSINALVNAVKSSIPASMPAPAAAPKPAPAPAPAPAPNTSGLPTCSSAAMVDPTSSLYGWDNGVSCLFANAAAAAAAPKYPDCTANAVPSTTSPNWGYENGKSCYYYPN